MQVWINRLALLAGIILLSNALVFGQEEILVESANNSQGAKIDQDTAAVENAEYSAIDKSNKSSWSFSGYVKQLQSFNFFNASFPAPPSFQGTDTLLLDNFFHHRLNIEWAKGEHWRVKAGLRTRLFYGDVVKSNPQYGEQISSGSNDWLNLGILWLNNSSLIGHTVLDRFYGEYTKESWEIRLGRQRVNWGISTVWNPNDIFNAYSFTDFDYEERPGADAVRVRYYTGYTGSLELAARASDRIEESILAGRWVVNTGGYDLQFIGGYAQNHWVLGTGWAGNLKNAGFKGEASWFYAPEIEKSSLAVTANIDYAFEKGLYLNAGGLYNSEGQKEGGILQLFTFELSARNLYPYRWASFVSLSYPVSPLVNAGLTTIYSPVASHALFLNPTVAVSVAGNWSLDAVGQLVFDQEAEGYRSPLQAVFLRVKWSY